MESISDVGSDQQINIIVQLLEGDSILSIPLQNKISINYHFICKKCIIGCFTIGYISFLLYSFHVLCLTRIHIKNNIWLISLLFTCNNLISIFILIVNNYKICKYIKYYISLTVTCGTFLVGWGIYEMFVRLYMLKNTNDPLFTLFCILLLTNVSFYSSMSTWYIFHIMRYNE
jgi:hypothetical protein